MISKTYRSFLSWSLGILCLGLVVVKAVAQSGEVTWSTPLNLSHSGAATNPVFSTDEFGGYHVIWQDQYAGYMYSVLYTETWSIPTPMLFPFSTAPFTAPGVDAYDKLHTPVLVTDENFVMHAFWTDDDNLLWYSHAVVSEIGLGVNSWLAPVQLATAVQGIDAVVGVNGRLHLAYIRINTTPELPAGVYHRASSDSGITWTDAISFYQSDYLRSVNSLTAHVEITAVSDQATIPVTTGEGEEAVTTEQTVEVDRLHVTWDDPDLDTVFTTRSVDGGLTWEEAQAIDFRVAEDPVGVPGPAQIRALPWGEQEVHLTWRASHEADKCVQYHQVSLDKGQTWQPRLEAYTDRECPSDSQFVTSLTNFILLLTSIREEAYLQAWDGFQWGSPQSQEPVASFSDPETYRGVTLNCLQTAVTQANQLLVVGCGKSNGDDIWAVERPLRELADWSSLFAPTPVWSQPLLVANSPVQLLPPQIVAAADGRLHAMWGETTNSVASGRIENTADGLGNSLYYSRLDAGSWSSPRPVVVSPEGKADQPTLASSQGRLFVAWSGGQSGGIYFSRALADRAASVTEWSEPQLLPAPSSAATSPHMIVDRAGTLSVAYTVSLNENRGIYLVQSTNNGTSWSEPIQVFDGVAAGWHMVGSPRLTMTGDETMHVLWTRQSLPSGTGTLELVYAHSEDNGQTWSEPRQVVQEQVLWSDIVGIGVQEVHRVWLSLNEERPLLWHQISTDNGTTWTPPARISDPNTTGGATIIILDAASQPHIFQLAQSNTGQLLLQEWLWDGSRWQPGQNADLGELATNADTVAAAAAPDNTLGIMYGSLLLDEESGLLHNYLQYTNRLWEAPGELPTPLPTLTPTPLPEPTQTPIPEPSLSPTIPLSTIASQGGSAGVMGSNNPIGSILFGIVPAALLVLVAFVFGLRLVRSK